MTSVSMTQLLAAASLPLESDSETGYDKCEYDPAVGCSLTSFGVRLRLTMSMTQLLAAASLPLESNSETDYEYEHDPVVGSSVPASGVQLRQTMTV